MVGPLCSAARTTNRLQIIGDPARTSPVHETRDEGPSERFGVAGFRCRDLYPIKTPPARSVASRVADGRLCCGEACAMPHAPVFNEILLGWL